MPILASDWLGQKLAGGRYNITERLGEGGMGTVYRAWDENLETEVVIKVPKRSMLDDPEFAGRFQREIRSLVRLSHPNVVKILDVGEQDGCPFCVMQCLSGGDLKARCTRPEDGVRTTMPFETLGAWLPAVADALDFIHQQRFIHRDVKPANILFDGHGNAYLSDFGVAKVVSEKSLTESSLTGTGMLLGTPEYIAPEMVLGLEFDGRVDQYALAVTVYEVLAGQLPLMGPTPSAILVKQTTEAPKPLSDRAPHVPRGAAEAVMKALSKKPEERFADCRSFAQQVLTAVNSGVASAPPAGHRLLRTVSAFFGRSNRETDTAVAAATIPVVQPAAPVALPPVAIVAAEAAIGPEKRRVSQRKRLIVAGVFGVLCIGTFPFWGELVAPQLAEVTTAVAKVNRVHSQGSSSSEQEQPRKAKELAAKERTVVKKTSLTPEERLQSVPIAEHAPQFSFTNSLGMRMICIRAGKFRSRDPSRWDTVDQPYWIADAEVTVAQYLHYCEQLAISERESAYPVWLLTTRKKSLKESRSEYDSLGEAHTRNGSPIVGLKVSQMESFCDWLSRQSNEPLEYSLPTVEQWTCAYRAGSTSPFCWGSEIDSTSGKLQFGDPHKSLAIVRQFPPNPWKLFDMAGNVWEATSAGTALGGGWDSDQTTEAWPEATRQSSSAEPNLGFRVVGVNRSQP